MNIQSLDDLFLHELQQLQVAENLFLIGLPKLTMTKAKPAAESITQAQGRIQRLEQVFKLLDHTHAASACRAMEGILADADHLLASVEDSDARGVAKAAAIQIGRCYLLVRYTLLVSWANQLGNSTVEKLLRATLDAESLLDKGESKASTIGSRLTALFDRKA
jgi:ferritin-like metal-binding protein YciE